MDWQDLDELAEDELEQVPGGLDANVMAIRSTGRDNGWDESSDPDPETLKIP